MNSLNMSILINTNYQLTIVIDYQLTENLYKRLQLELMNLVKKILLADFAGKKHSIITQAIYMLIMIIRY